MSDRLVLQDGRAWKASSWFFSYTLKELAERLPDEQDSLRQWLLARRELPSGLMGFDFRGLAPANRNAVVTAALQFAIDPLGGDVDTPQRLAMQKGARRLAEMLEAIARGEPPEDLSDYSELIEFDGHMIDLRGRGA